MIHCSKFREHSKIGMGFTATLRILQNNKPKTQNVEHYTVGEGPSLNTLVSCSSWKHSVTLRQKQNAGFDSTF